MIIVRIHPQKNVSSFFKGEKKNKKKKRSTLFPANFKKWYLTDFESSQFMTQDRFIVGSHA